MFAIAGKGQFAARQAAVAGERFLRWLFALAVAVGHFVRQIGKRVVNLACLRQPATDDGVIGFLSPLLCNQLAKQACGRRVKREQQYAAGRAVKTVCRIALESGLFLQDLQHGFVCVPLQRAAVDEQPRRFVYGDEVCVAVEDGEGSHGDMIRFFAIQAGCEPL